MNPQTSIKRTVRNVLSNIPTMANFLSFWSTVFPFESNDVRFENIFCYRKMFSQQKLTSYLKYFTAFRWDKF